MLRFKKLINKFIGKTHIDKSWIENKSSLLLHISDTPSQFYPELKRIIDIINPRYIIHTGDLADNIKIEFSSSLLTKYKHEVRKILKILETSPSESVYISLGNHDDFDFINNNRGRIKVYKNLGKINLNSTKIAFSHYHGYLNSIDADIYLFGHNIENNNLITASTIYLNGIVSINIINLDTLNVKSIDYPLGTDSARMKKNRIRI